MILIILSVLAVALLYFYLIRPHGYWKNIGVNGPKPFFGFGNIFENIIRKKSLAELIRDLYFDFKHEKYFGVYQFLRPVLVVNDPELIKQITIKDFDHFTDHMNHAREDVDPLWSRNIFSMTGDRWRDMRATLSPAFTSSKMRMMFGFINEVAEGFVEYMMKKDEKVCTLELKDTFTRITNDVIASCAFGIRCDSLGERENEFYVKARRGFDFSGLKQAVFFMYNSTPKLMKLFGLKIFSDEIANFFRKAIKDTTTERKEKNIIRPDMIHLLLEAQKGQLDATTSPTDIDSFASVQEYSLDNKNAIRKKVLISDEDITGQALIFFFGGFDTTSYLMCFLAYELAINPDIQDKLREEIEETLTKCNGKITYEALMKMNYLDMIVSETLRKWPPAPIIDRICTKQYVIPAEDNSKKDLVLQPGTVIWVPTFGIHRNPDIYPNPDKFDPERFNTENRSKINNSTYLAFGSGPRNCIGSRFALLENKAIIFNILKHFEIVPVKETVIPLVISKRNLNTTSEGGFWLGLKRR